MSSTLKWEPASRTKKTLPDELKYVLRKRYGNPINTIINSAEWDYLLGLRDAGIPKVDDLIKAIDKHGAIKLAEEW